MSVGALWDSADEHETCGTRATTAGKVDCFVGGKSAQVDRVSQAAGRRSDHTPMRFRRWRSSSAQLLVSVTTKGIKVVRMSVIATHAPKYTNQFTEASFTYSYVNTQTVFSRDNAIILNSFSAAHVWPFDTFCFPPNFHVKRLLLGGSNSCCSRLGGGGLRTEAKGKGRRGKVGM